MTPESPLTTPTHAVPWRALMPLSVAVPIAVGGALGALARYGVTRALPVAPGQFPWGTWLVNTTGCLVLGLVLGAVTLGAHVHRTRRAFLATGVLGAFTTFSTWAIDVDRLSAHGHVATALVDVVGSLLSGLAALVAGSMVVRARHRRLAA